MTESNVDGDYDFSFCTFQPWAGPCKSKAASTAFSNPATNALHGKSAWSLIMSRNWEQN